MDTITLTIDAHTGNMVVKQRTYTTFPGESSPREHIHMYMEIDPRTNTVCKYEGFSKNGRKVHLEVE